MSETVSRRSFIATAAAAPLAGTAAFAQSDSKQPAALRGAPPIIISSANGLPATQKAADMIAAGADPLDAVIAGVNIVEADPNDHSVGYGGLPNEDGIVELDSSVMHGPTHKAGAVAALRNIMHPSQVARLVMQRTDHVLIVGEGALRFARAHGFEEINLLTDDARKIWLKWKESHSQDDDWLPPLEPADKDKHSAAPREIQYTYGTIHCSALDANGNIAGVTTTSGLSYKIPGRVGDSPIIGAGLYVDNEIGAAGSTGRGESVIQNAGAFAAVELMRAGTAPTDACLEVLKRIAKHTTDKRLRQDDGRPNFDVKMYALAKDGRFGSASIWSGGQFAVYADGRNRLEDCAALYERK
ncbi:MAG: N(4)-(beta-N-acetylglucosaminyl)-L-asparaginase [Phycisphaerales bacterium]|nr:N(4)-(beta-N-acetylglucosaminyl)-L-asparaginase [Phycisphaerales bacterium]